MRVDTNANGNTMNGASPSGGSVFTSVTGTTSSSITYDNSTTTYADQLAGTITVTNTPDPQHRRHQSGNGGGDGWHSGRQQQRSDRGSVPVADGDWPPGASR
jgi:hypothetical protein